MLFEKNFMRSKRAPSSYPKASINMQGEVDSLFSHFLSFYKNILIDGLGIGIKRMREEL